jgi:hypothetical protein
MRSHVALGLVLSALVAAPVVAHAETPTRFHTTMVPIAQPTGGGGPSSSIIFLNRCEGDCVVYPGNDDSRDNVSGIINGTRSVSEFSGTDAQWDAIVACVQLRYSPFDVTVTDVDPGSNVEHFEAIVAGDPGDIDQPCGDQGCVLGVSPYDRFGCGVINNAITYTFANTILQYLSSPISNICDTVAQETAHAFTLDHELLASDPMTYLDYSGERAFQNIDAQCGEYQNDPRQCYCGGSDNSESSQNSFQDLYALFGAAAPTPPEVAITEPADGDVVEGGFVVRVDVSDPQGIARVELLIDGAVVSEITSAPWVLNAPASLGNGNHIVIARAFDGAGTAGTDEVTVTVGAPCSDGDCEEGLACVDGRCVVGPGEDGGLGEPCLEHAECVSGLCARSGDEGYCTETCSLDDGFCPSGFACTNAGGTGVCWPGEGGSGGCVVTESSRGGASNGLPLAFGTLLALFLIRRRR